MKATITVLVVLIAMMAVHETHGWLTKVVHGAAKLVNWWFGDNIRLLRKMSDMEFDSFLEEAQEKLERDFGKMKTDRFLDMLVEARYLSDEEFNSMTNDDYIKVSRDDGKIEKAMARALHGLLKSKE
uniref:uncharacterized protein LOC120335940 n=1 Tax=Styela clava TaxID=7725 RepID=UPI00193ABF21|nr:uncharacterized protein LOC120335940 [Styela clava]